MAVLSGTSGAVKVGATSTTAIGNVISWTLNETLDEYPRKSLGVAYTTRDTTGHTDWTSTIEVDLDESDTILMALLVKGVAATLFLYDDTTNSKGMTGAGVVTAYSKVVSGTAANHVSVTVGGNAAIAAIS